MTTTTRSASGVGRRRATRRAHLPVLAAAGVLTGLVLGGGTFALWSGGDDVALGQIVTGDLNLTLDGDAIWDETSADVQVPQTGLDPASFLVRPGDSFEITQGFTATLQGDNMLAEVSVSWGDPAALPDGVQASYVVVDSEGEGLSEPADLGTAVVLDPVASDNAGSTDAYALVIDLEFGEDVADRFGEDDDAVLADLGEFVIELDQTRRGEGVTS